MDDQAQQTIQEKQPPVLFKETQQLVRQISAQLDGTLLCYWNNPRGEVCHNDVLVLYELLESIGRQEKVYLFIKSNGGNGKASLRFVNLLRQYTQRFIALAPLECASAATMIAIGADQIQMGPLAYLTAVDTSLTHDLSPIDRDNDRVSVSLDELKRVIRLWREEKSDSMENPFKSLYQYVHPLVIGAVDRADSLSIMLCRELLASHMDDETAIERIASELNTKYPSHSYPILIDEARRLGLKTDPMDPRINQQLLQLNKLYSEMGQKATTDYDDTHAHGNEILNIFEAPGIQLYFQQDMDWFYREQERRWIRMNDNSSWRKLESIGGKTRRSVLHIA